MHRFFIEEVINKEDKEVTIHKSEDVKHIAKALRVKVGEPLEICDGHSKEYIVMVKSISEVVVCHDIKVNDINRESPLRIDLYQGLAKGSKMDTIIQKAVELGVRSVVPTLMHRSIVKIDAQGEKKKTERWQKIADEAAKQSKRSHLPTIEPVVNLSKLKDLSKYDLILLAYEQENTLKVKEAIEDFSGQNIAVFIGPEGGFEESEIDVLEKLGGKSISLGSRILRTETAGVMLLSILQYALGDV